jgi:phage terminase large subunit-like protein
LSLEPAWSPACPDWESRIAEGRSLVPELPALWRERGARALRVFKRLRLPDVFGTPRLADAGGPWFFDIVAALFGSYDPECHRRAIPEVFILVPKKNAKSTCGAGLILTAALITDRPAAEFVLIAPTKEIADISYGQAEGMIKADPELDKIFHRQAHYRRITDRRTDAVIEVKAADTETITGGKQVATLVDETHEFARKPRARDVFVEIRGALAARPDGFLVQITTQSKTPPSGVFRSELNTARAVRDGRLKLPMLPVLYELPPTLSKDWRERRYWPVVNPNLGRSVDEVFLVNGLIKAEEEGAEALALFASQHFNVEIGLALQSDRWVGADYWERQGDPALTLEAILDRAEVVVMGIDGGGLDDLLAASVLGRDAKTRQWLLWVRAWAYAGVLERRKSEAARLRDLEATGDLVINEQLGDDIAELAEICGRVDETGKLAHVGLDLVGVGLIVDALDEKHINGDRVVGISQGWRLTNAIKTTERKLADGSLVHGAQPLMAWAVGNAKVEPRGNAILITKQASGTAKIDPLMAAFDAIALMSANPNPRGSIYDDAAEYAAAFGRPRPGGGEGDESETWSPAILADVTDPRFAEHKRRFETWQAKQPDEDRDAAG